MGEQSRIIHRPTIRPVFVHGLIQVLTRWQPDACFRAEAVHRGPRFVLAALAATGAPDGRFRPEKWPFAKIMVNAVLTRRASRHGTVNGFIVKIGPEGAAFWALPS